VNRSSNQNPEQISRDLMDSQLRAAGWAVQSKEGQAIAWIEQADVKPLGTGQLVSPRS